MMSILQLNYTQMKISIEQMDQETQPTPSNRKVAYFYNSNIGKFVYSRDHPMKPQRIAMAHSLIVNFELYRKLNVYHARQSIKQEMTRFHNEQYIQFLQNYVVPDVSSKILAPPIDRFSYPQETNERLTFLSDRQRFKVGESTDCPAFPGLYNYCQISTSGSIDSAALLLNGQADIAINWGGGLHHAKKAQASGFCYVNDIVLAILQLLQVYPRVLYVDIDVHHGDGVEEAFFLSNRVMTVSFHQYGEEFFPGTGNISEVGEYDGKNYSLNIPLKPGMDDNTFYHLFRDIMQGVMQKYRPHALVMQLGSDSLCHDKLGNFNLSLQGHGMCLKYMLNFAIPTILLGGGGYTVQNVSRCWSYETGIALGIELDKNTMIPKHDPFYSRYGWDQKLHFPVKNVQNQNSYSQINTIRQKAYEIIREIQSAPCVQFHHLPSNLSPWDNLGEEEYSQSTQEQQQGNII